VVSVALLVAAVLNGLLVVWILVTTAPNGSAIDYAAMLLDALSAYGCWVAGRHLRQQHEIQSLV
jgi:hypothetical protein